MLPMLFSKLLRKKAVMALAGSATQSTKAESSALSLPIGLMARATFKLSGRIICYTEGLVPEYGLPRYRNKISIAHEHFIDFGRFKMRRRLDERDNLVGYIGRLSREKGVLNFVQAIPEILKERGDFEFLIGGDGQLRNEIKEYLDKEKLSGKVKVKGWIPHDEVPEYLSTLKLLVLPSYTEGLPNIVLEAMACGTPVLATPVGAVPDVIKDGETGFIIEDNPPQSLAQNVIRALNYPNLMEVAQNARALVEKEFTYEKAVEKYREILGNLFSNTAEYLNQ